MHFIAGPACFHEIKCSLYPAWRYQLPSRLISSKSVQQVCCENVTDRDTVSATELACIFFVYVVIVLFFFSEQRRNQNQKHRKNPWTTSIIPQTTPAFDITECEGRAPGGALSTKTRTRGETKRRRERRTVARATVTAAVEKKVYVRRFEFLGFAPFWNCQFDSAGKWKDKIVLVFCGQLHKIVFSSEEGVKKQVDSLR